MWCNEEVGTVHFRGREGMPVWSITHFLQNTCLNHMKLVIIERICELSAQGVPSGAFWLASQSAGLFSRDLGGKNDFSHKEKDWVIGADQEDFWQGIDRIHRPVVMQMTEEGLTPVYHFTDPAAARIRAFRERSPWEGVLEGAVRLLSDLRYAHCREKREQEEHIHKQVGQAARNYQEIIMALETIHQRQVPEGIKIYAAGKMERLLRKQTELNRKIGLEEGADGRDIEI